MKLENIKLKDYIGTWYVIDRGYYRGQEVFLLESEIYGDETQHLIINDKYKVLLDDIWNGFNDLV